MCISSHRSRSLATTKLQEHLSAAAVAVRRDGDRLCRFVYWMAMRDQRRHVESWLTPSDLVAARNWDAITALAEASGLTP
jgi:hypothetical protein